MARPRLSLTSARDPSRLHTRGGSAASSPAACRASHFGNRHRHRSHGRQTRVGPGGMWPCPRCRAGPRSPSPARPMTSARSQQRLTSYRRLFPDSSVMLTETISLTLDVHLRLRGRRKLALFDDSDRDSTHCGCEYGDRSGAARLSGLGNSSYHAPWCRRCRCCGALNRLARSRKVSPTLRERISGIGRLRVDTERAG